ncbi:uncharacterized protein LOC124257800 [Haliotis rubra]|uniref:uncharacterized protein LOC124257800 n=1 Tax=Haliotis rubra TaxID=36100 RepID=UPI001EE54451|nr:uncharacterized protein LOC124257800 [Haliotis rubra]
MLGIILLTLVAGALAAPMTTPSGPTTTLDLVAVITTAFNTLDADKNGQVDLAEFYKAFDKFDTNDDHEMSLQEYVTNTNVSQSVAQLVFKFFDKDHDGSVDRAETNDVYKLYDTNKNGVITIQEFIREYTRIYDAIIVGLFSTTAPGAATTFDLAAVITATFNIIDADSNGQVDRKEFYAAFDRLDTNGDQKMTLQEYMANTNVSQSVAQLVFKFMDKNSDGSVDRSEMTDVFNLFDTNKDGEISKQEFVREYTKIYNNVAAGLYPTTAATMATKS